MQAVSSYATVQVEGHVTPGLGNAANSVLQAFMEINVSRVRQNVTLLQFNGLKVQHKLENVMKQVMHCFSLLIYDFLHKDRLHSTPCGSVVKSH